VQWRHSVGNTPQYGIVRVEKMINVSIGGYRLAQFALFQYAT